MSWRSDDEQQCSSCRWQNEGRVLHAFGEEVIIHLDGERTDGKLTMWTEVTPPGGGPPPHYHLNEDETFRVLEGRVAVISAFGTGQRSSR